MSTAEQRLTLLELIGQACALRGLRLARQKNPLRWSGQTGE